MRESRFEGNRMVLLGVLASTLFFGSGCYLTKVVSVPMRLVGAAASILPVVGNPAHDAIDSAADAVEL